MFEKVTIITLLYLTTLGDIKQESFEIVSKQSCESWYEANVRVLERKKERCLVVYIITNTKVNRLLDMYVVMNHHNSLELF